MLSFHNIINLRNSLWIGECRSAHASPSVVFPADSLPDSKVCKETIRHSVEPDPVEPDSLEADPVEHDLLEPDLLESGPVEPDPLEPDLTESVPVVPVPVEPDPIESDPIEPDPDKDQTAGKRYFCPM